VVVIGGLVACRRGDGTDPALISADGRSFVAALLRMTGRKGAGADFRAGVQL
jgi:hypothetical protein